jgi:hypothetical protein
MTKIIFDEENKNLPKNLAFGTKEALKKVFNPS